jgi:hypothetical protein
MKIDDKSDSKDNLDLKSKSTIVNRKPENNKHISGVDKTFSHRRGVLRIFMGLVALLLWIIIGVSPTIIFSSSIQEFIGAFSFLVKNPIIFLLVACSISF